MENAGTQNERKAANGGRGQVCSWLLLKIEINGKDYHESTPIK